MKNDKESLVEERDLLFDKLPLVHSDARRNEMWERIYSIETALSKIVKKERKRRRQSYDVGLRSS